MRITFKYCFWTIKTSLCWNFIWSTILYHNHSGLNNTQLISDSQKVIPGALGYRSSIIQTEIEAQRGHQSHSCGSVYYLHIQFALFHHAGQAGAWALIMVGLTMHPSFQRLLPVDNKWKEVINPFKRTQQHTLISKALIDVSEHTAWRH